METLVYELFALSAKAVRALPCEAAVQDEILVARDLKGGALKRQGKYIAKMLRRDSETVGELLSHMEERRGSKLKEDGEFHELERLRDTIINDAIAVTEAQIAASRQTHPSDKLAEAGEVGNGIERAMMQLPGLAETELKKAATLYAQTRQPRYSREIFRILKAGLERKKFEVGRDELIIEKGK